MVKLVVLGSITEDIIITPDSEKQHFVGGVPIYAAATAKALGERIGIVSKVGTDFQMSHLDKISSLGADLEGFKIAGERSMRFQNKYDLHGNRAQKVLSVSEKITFEDIPSSYLSVPCVHLGPVFNEINPDLILKVRAVFPFVSLDGQGFTRSLSKDDSVILEPWLDYKEYLPKIDFLKVDDTELKGIIGVSRLKEAIQLALKTGIEFLVITRAHKGAIIYHKKRRFDIPAIPTTEVDATGAGDTYITAFLLEFLRTQDCLQAGLIAAAAASFKIATSGPFPRYTREKILQSLRKNIPYFTEKLAP